jgi:hypothetical protein
VLISGLDEDEEVDVENEIAFEPEFEGLYNDLPRILAELQMFDLFADDDDDDDDMQWDETGLLPPTRIRAHHHHHRHGLNDVFGMIGGGPFRGESNTCIPVEIKAKHSQVPAFAAIVHLRTTAAKTTASTPYYDVKAVTTATTGTAQLRWTPRSHVSVVARSCHTIEMA